MRKVIEAAWSSVMSPLFADLSADVTLQNVRKDVTETDPLYDEPTTTVVLTDPVAVKARVRLKKDRIAAPGGEEIEIDGTASVRREELEAKSVELKGGTRLIWNGTTFTVVQTESRGLVGDVNLLVRAALRVM